MLDEADLIHRKITLDTMLLGNIGGPKGLLGDLSMAVYLNRGPVDESQATKDFRPVRKFHELSLSPRSTSLLDLTILVSRHLGHSFQFTI